MDALKKWMISWFTQHQTITYPKWLFSQKLFFKSSLLLNEFCSIQTPQTSSDDLCLLFCIYPSSMADKLQVLYVIYDYMILYNVTNLNKNGFFLTLYNIQAFCSIFSFLDFNYNTNMF